MKPRDEGSDRVKPIKLENNRQAIIVFLKKIQENRPLDNIGTLAIIILLKLKKINKSSNNTQTPTMRDLFDNQACIIGNLASKIKKTNQGVEKCNLIKTINS